MKHTFFNMPPPTRTALDDTEVFREVIAEHVEKELAVAIELKPRLGGRRCPLCKRRVLDDWKFCGYCATALKRQT